MDAVRSKTVPKTGLSWPRVRAELFTHADWPREPMTTPGHPRAIGINLGPADMPFVRGYLADLPQAVADARGSDGAVTPTEVADRA